MIDTTPKNIRVAYYGSGHGYWVICDVERAGLREAVKLSGPFTTREQADAECERIRTQDEAREMGREAGRAAASWYFDGNTTREHYARVLQGIEDGDPEIMDTIPSAPLSGEWADDPLPGDILRALGVDEYDEQTDNYLNVYADGYEEAALAHIEDSARRMLEEEEEPPSVQELAKQVCGRFTRRTRADGTSYTTLTDAARTWMHDLVRNAHGDMLPDDWRYECIASACEAIADAQDPDDHADEFADGYVDVYSADLVAWFASHGKREEYVAAGREWFGDAGEDIYEEFRRGQYLEAREVYYAVLDELEEWTDDEPASGQAS
jgi:hypothetical protein